jgi:hypothetical protein
MYDIALSHQHLLGLFAYLPQQRLAQEFLVIDLLYALIEIEGRHTSVSEGLPRSGFPIFVADVPLSIELCVDAARGRRYTGRRGKRKS